MAQTYSWAPIGPASFGGIESDDSEFANRIAYISVRASKSSTQAPTSNTVKLRLSSWSEPARQVETHALLAIGFQIDRARIRLDHSIEFIDEPIRKTVAL